MKDQQSKSNLTTNTAGIKPGSTTQGTNVPQGGATKQTGFNQNRPQQVPNANQKGNIPGAGKDKLGGGDTRK
jgi:hypothetical protein